MKESITTLDKVSEVYNGNSINAEYKRKYFCGLDEGYPFIATKDIAMNGIVDYDNGVKIPYGTKYKIAEPNSVFICAEGGSAGRKIAFIDRKVCFGNKLFCIKPNSESLLGKYVYYYTNSDGFQTQFKKLLAGLIGGVSISKFKSISIPLPPLAEQRKIVDFLDTQFRNIDALKNNAEQQLQAAKDLFQSALASLLTPQNNWETKTLGEIGNFKRGGSFTKSDFVSSGIPCIHYGQIHMKFGVKTEKNISFLPQSCEAKAKFAEKGDLIIAITSEDNEGSCKCTAWMGDEKVAVGGHIAVYHHSLDPQFVSYYFRSPKFQKDKLDFVHGFKVVEIKPSDIAKISITYPKTRDEQAYIVKELDTLSGKVQSLQDNYTQTLTLCNDLKQALLKQIFD